MVVQFGQNNDINDWANLVNELKTSFPGLGTRDEINEHIRLVLEFMDKKEALCVKIDKKIVGVLLFSKDKNMICCLGVSSKYRKIGIGSMLLEEAINNLDRKKEIVVSTFREEDKNGIAPRNLYKKFGFVEGELIEEFGYPAQKLILSPIT